MMKAGPSPQMPQVGSQVTTACGSMIKFAPDTPYSNYKGRSVYFCLPVCKQDFDENPQFSCLMLQLALEGEMDSKQ